MAVCQAPEERGLRTPAGHPDEGEDSVEAAVRELMEETGALDFALVAIDGIIM